MRSGTSASSARGGGTSSATSSSSGSSPRTARPRAEIVTRPAMAGADIDLSDVPGDLRRPVGAALHAAGVDDGHIGVEIVGGGRMRTLNYAARGVDEATDVLAFPIDEGPPEAGPRAPGAVFRSPGQATSGPDA